MNPSKKFSEKGLTNLPFCDMGLPLTLCNCDDPFESAFSKYFLKNFNVLKLKKLICTSYKGSRIVSESRLCDSEKTAISNNFAYVMEVSNLPYSTDSIIDDELITEFLKSKGVVKKLKGDGDFRSNECVAYLKEADIIVTNPPFSKFTELFSLITKYNKKYLLIGNQNAITYKEVFPYIKNGTAWIGYCFGDMAFKVPDDTLPRKTRFWVDESGQKWRSLGNIISLSEKNGVNMIIGGPPCQGYSMKGKKLGLDDPRNFLFIEYLNLVEKLQPDVFVIENVKTLLSTSKGWFKEQILSAIGKLGYQVDVGVLKASDFGVPQNRERTIFICCKNKKITLPTATVNKPVTVREAISDLAYLESNEGAFEQAYKMKATSDYQKMMRKNSKMLYNHQASNHAKIAIEKLSMIPPEKGKECLPKEMLGKQKFHSTWGRLKWDEPSPTIDTRFDAASNGTNNHPFLNRAITPREAARLQSFDDNYIFYGTKVAVRTQIGNAVPPLMAKAIADRIFDVLSKEDKGDDVK
ncbi:MAG: DNA (cytosine-5-)-methyltransferase [Clostridia bacterium]|nr:DNA (cytosine-5-)-methyltransferase [Clostridia bacterium]